MMWKIENTPNKMSVFVFQFHGLEIISYNKCLSESAKGYMSIGYVLCPWQYRYDREWDMSQGKYDLEVICMGVYFLGVSGMGYMSGRGGYM